MSQIFLKECCMEEKLYIGHFSKEPSVLCCGQCFKDGVLNGVKKLVDLKTKRVLDYGGEILFLLHHSTKQEVSINA